MGSLISTDRPVLILAPMQDITDLPFWRVLMRYGGPDIFYTEYFRVHRDSRPEKHILQSIVENPTGRPVYAQMIGQDISALQRTAQALQKTPIAGIDLNFGCPAPIVCKKEAGGGLLRQPERIGEILHALRSVVTVRLTAKTRLGFDTPEEFPRLLDVFRAQALDALTVHGRTVREMYGPVVHYEAIARAVRLMPCPVHANGNVRCVESAQRVARQTGAAGLMIGRGAIRNPWLFTQIREAWTTGQVQTQPTSRDVRGYIEALYESIQAPEMRDIGLTSRLKKYLNYIASGPTDDAFWPEARRAQSLRELFAVCDRYLDNAEPFAPTDLLRR